MAKRSVGAHSWLEMQGFIEVHVDTKAWELNARIISEEKLFAKDVTRASMRA